MNRAGQRFCDESFYKDSTPKLRTWDGHAQNCPNQPSYMVFDESYRERYPVGSFMPGQELPAGFVESAATPQVRNVATAVGNLLQRPRSA